MKRKKGIHFYINVDNFNKIVLDEENKTGKVNHSIHALDTFFSSVERYGKKYYKDVITIEKITGARLHIYITDGIFPAYDCLKKIAIYSLHLSKFINNEISKYKTLLDFNISIGACFGSFYEFTFRYSKSGASNLEFEELTTIGYAANYAAKLQGLAGISKICISEDLYTEHNVQEDGYIKKWDQSIGKYGQKCYYEAPISSLGQKDTLEPEDLAYASEYAKKVNLTEMSFTNVSKPLSFDSLSKSSGKKVKGIPLFADVRGFTAKFRDDDSNLEQMTKETEKILSTMYGVATKNKGIHVQFQGDREEILFHDIGEIKCYEDAVLAGMRIVDKIKSCKVHVGVGADYGNLYATRIGARGEKDNILIGSTVIESDRLEDKVADEDQIVISENVYQGLVEQNSKLASFFKKKSGKVYITTKGYQDYLEDVSSSYHHVSTQNSDYNGAWGANY